MLKFSIFHPHFADGGVERTTLILGKELVRLGHDVDVVTIRPQPAFLDRFGDGVTLTDLGTGRVRYSVLPLWRYLRRRKPDILISNQSYANVSASLAHLLARSKAKLFLCERVDPLAPGQTKSGRLMRWAYRRADVTMTNSRALAERLAGFLGTQPSGVSVIYNPTVTPELEAESKEPVDHSWFAGPTARGPADPTVPVILGAGRLSEQKDFPTLIKAFALVRSDRHARLMILGEGPERASLEGLAARLGIADDVCLPGFDANPYKYLARAAMFVLSSRWEGLPNVVIEAQALGVPVVSTDCPTGPREILFDGEAGLLVPMGDAQAMAEAIERVLGDQALARRLVQRGKEGIDRFTPGPCAARYLELAGFGEG